MEEATEQKQAELELAREVLAESVQVLEVDLKDAEGVIESQVGVIKQAEVEKESWKQRAERSERKLKEVLEQQNAEEFPAAERVSILDELKKVREELANTEQARLEACANAGWLKEARRIFAVMRC